MVSETHEVKQLSCALIVYSRGFYRLYHRIWLERDYLLVKSVMKRRENRFIISLPYLMYKKLTACSTQVFQKKNCSDFTFINLQSEGASAADLKKLIVITLSKCIAVLLSLYRLNLKNRCLATKYLWIELLLITLPSNDRPENNSTANVIV